MPRLPFPPPRQLPWPLKPLDSAQTSLGYDNRARMVMRIRHELLRGITPAMIDWWFRNIAGDMDVAGVRCYMLGSNGTSAAAATFLVTGGNPVAFTNQTYIRGTTATPSCGPTSTSARPSRSPSGCGRSPSSAIATSSSAIRRPTTRRRWSAW